MEFTACIWICMYMYVWVFNETNTVDSTENRATNFMKIVYLYLLQEYAFVFMFKWYHNFW